MLCWVYFACISLLSSAGSHDSLRLWSKAHTASPAQGNSPLEMVQNTDCNRHKRFAHKIGNGVFFDLARSQFDSFDSDWWRDRAPKGQEMLGFSHLSPPMKHSSSQNYNQSQDAEKVICNQTNYNQVLAQRAYHIFRSVTSRMFILHSVIALAWILLQEC